MSVRLKKLQSETIKLIQGGDCTQSDQGTTALGASLSRFNFKDRLMSPEGGSTGLTSPTNGGGVQEVI